MKCGRGKEELRQIGRVEGERKSGRGKEEWKGKGRVEGDLKYCTDTTIFL